MKNKLSTPRSFLSAASRSVSTVVLIAVFACGVAAQQWTGPDASNNISSANSGNVGIGTSNPSAKLHVQRDVNGDNSIYVLNNGGGASSRSLILFGEEASNAKYAYFGHFGANYAGSGPAQPRSTLFVGADAGGFNLVSFGGASQTGGKVSFWTSPDVAGGGNDAVAERMRIDKNGHIGIGTSSPNSLLEIRKDAGGATGPTLTLSNITGGTGAGGAIDFANPGLGVPQQAQIRSSDNNDWSANLLFSTKVPGGGTNTLAERMRITSTGNVGIGTTSPSDLLQIDSAAGWGFRIRYITSGNYLRMSENQISAFTSGGAGRDLYLNTAGGNVGIGTTNPEERLHVAGSIKVDGNINAKYQDLAEWVPSSEQLSAGTVVVLDPTKSNQVVSATVAYDTRVAGVISAQPGITLGEGGEGKVLVATTGRVRVKVDASRGAIQIGDLLVTSDVSGVAMKSEPVEFAGRKMHMPGTIIGKALEPLVKGSGEILVLLSLQ